MKPRDERFEHLVAEALHEVQSIASRKSRLEKLHKELDAYFPGVGAVEHATTEYGTAMRILDDVVTIDPSCVQDVMACLGNRFSRYFATKPRFEARESARAVLANGDSPLAHSLRDFLFVQRNRHFVFIPGKAERVIDVP